MIILGVLISGRGSNLMAIVEAIEEGRLDAKVAIVLSDRADAPGLSFAKDKGILAHAVLPKSYLSKDDYENKIVSHLKDASVDYVVLAGYMRLVGPVLLREYDHRILNIHPSLLPDFKGLHAQRQALEAGVSESGCTVHYVDETLDGGRILAQAKVPVLPGDTELSLSDRILVEEHRLYSEVLQTLSLKGES